MPRAPSKVTGWSWCHVCSTAHRDQSGSRSRDQTEQLSQSGGKFGSAEPSSHLLPWPYGTGVGTEGSLQFSHAALALEEDSAKQTLAGLTCPELLPALQPAAV